MKKILAVLLTLMMLVPVYGLGEGTEAAEIPEAAAKSVFAALG